MKKTTDQKIEILLNDTRGVYIPRDFVQGFDMEAWHITDQDMINDLQEPENEWYWESWESLMNNAYFVDSEGMTWRLYQEGDLFALSDELTENEHNERFGY
jgi:hypothetical protein